MDDAAAQAIAAAVPRFPLLRPSLNQRVQHRPREVFLQCKRSGLGKNLKRRPAHQIFALQVIEVGRECRTWARKSDSSVLLPSSSHGTSRMKLLRAA